MIESLIVILVICAAAGLLAGLVWRALRRQPKGCCGSSGSACSGCAQGRDHRPS